MRKTPQQARSREMVERIVAAARQVLVSGGYEGFSTNRVARAAGVSPGSLYQYFPDKAALLDVVLDRYWDDVAARVAAALTDRLGGLGPDTFRGVAEALVAAVESDPVLLRVLGEELPLARNRVRRAALERQVRDVLTAALAARPELSRRPDPALAAWLLVLVAEQLAQRWVLDEPGFSRETFLDEFATLVGAYLAA